MEKNERMEAIVSLAKRRGFIFRGSDIYGGLSGTWDYGPLGVSLKRNIMKLWWDMFVDSREDMYGVDAAILMNQKVWQASGHVATFTDPLISCNFCHSKFRTDKILNTEDYFETLKSYLKYFLDKLDQKLLNNQYALEDLDSIYEYYGAKDPRSKDSINDLKNMESELTKDKYILDDLKRARNFTGEFPSFYLEYHKQKCEVCSHVEWGISNKFNMMFETFVGPNAFEYRERDIQQNANEPSHIVNAKYDDRSISYLRPETAQGIFTNFKNVLDTFYPDLPFGLAQQGKAFRNEISPRDFIFRSREFEQMEIEYFVDPEKWEQSFEHWRQQVWLWVEALGLPTDSVHELEVPEEDRAHYSKRTIDFEFDFPIGREELLGLAYRTDFDLKNIQNAAGKSMDYTIKGTTTKFIPHVIEPSFGVERAIMAVLSAAYTVDTVGGEERAYLKLPEHLAPIRYAVSPLVRNKPELVEKARDVFALLKKKYGAVMWDDNGNIGKRYRRQDEIGTPYCIVVDFDTLEDGTVTIRSRDTTEQTRVLPETI